MIVNYGDNNKIRLQYFCDETKLMKREYLEFEKKNLHLFLKSVFKIRVLCAYSEKTKAQSAPAPILVRVFAQDAKRIILMMPLVFTYLWFSTSSHCLFIGDYISPASIIFILFAPFSHFTSFK